MARLTFPSDRLVYQASTYAGSAFTSSAGATATVYSDANGTTLADVQNIDGTANPSATFTVDTSSRLPLFLGPANGSDTLYVKVGTGPVTPIYAVTAGDISAAVGTEVTNRQSADALLAKPRGAWAPTTAYAVNDVVISGGTAYRCLTAHTSGGSFSGAGVNWESWGTATSSTGTVARGYVVPAGSLDTFKTAFKAHASQLCEISVLGDSTTYGNDDDQATYYSWLQRLRDNLTAAGVTHGGTGVFHKDDAGHQPLFEESGYPLVTATSGWTDVTPITGVNGFASTAAGTKTIQGKGTAIRLNIAKSNTGGRVGYTIDGGTEVLVDTLIRQPPTNAYDVQPTLISGLTEGVHTVVIRNAGASDILLPSNPVLQSFGGGGGPAAGTYYYKVTAVSANGESTPVACNPVGITVNGAQVPQVLVYGQSGWTAIKLYRATTQNGTYGLVQTLSSLTVGAQNGVNDNTGLAPGAAPPSSSTLGSYTGNTRTEVGVEFIRSAGVVLHKEATAGNVMTAYFDHVNNSATTRAYSPAVLGLQSENQATSSSGYMWGLPQGSKPTYRNTKLTIIQIGTNDIGSGSPAADGSTQTNWDNYFENLAFALRTIRAAGSDCILISPPFTQAVDVGAQHYAGRFKTALLSLALAYGCAYVDFQEAIGWDVVNLASRDYATGAPGHPHLHIAGYQAEADYIWQKVLQPLLTQS